MNSTKCLISIGMLVGLLLLACSHDPVVSDPAFNFDDATGPPMKVSVTQNESIVNPSTSIFISIPESGDITFIVYGSTGAKIRTLADGPVGAGEFTIQWDGRNEAGKSIKSGIYIFMIHFIGDSQVIKQYQPVYFQAVTE